MPKELAKQLINSWEWLDAFCLTQRGDCGLACGKHAVLVVRIDGFDSLKREIGPERTKELLANIEDVMKSYALEDTLVARYNESTFAVILHYIADRDEIFEMGEEIRENIHVAANGWRDKVTVSVGAAECHHDPQQGYKCATALAMEALAKAMEEGNRVVVAPDTLPPHPMAVAMAAGK